MARIDVDGLSTWTETRGSGEHTVVLLHGGLEQRRMLDSMGASSTERYRVVAFDRRGHGYTADTERRSTTTTWPRRPSPCSRRVVGGPAHLVGWSDGGIVALLVALRRPDLVDRLVLIGVNFHFDGMLPIGARRRRRSPR